MKGRGRGRAGRSMRKHAGALPGCPRGFRVAAGRGRGARRGRNGGPYRNAGPPAGGVAPCSGKEASARRMQRGSPPSKCGTPSAGVHRPFEVGVSCTRRGNPDPVFHAGGGEAAAHGAAKRLFGSAGRAGVELRSRAGRTAFRPEPSRSCTRRFGRQARDGLRGFHRKMFVRQARAASWAWGEGIPGGLPSGAQEQGASVGVSFHL